MASLTSEYIADRLKEIVGPDRVTTNYIDREVYMQNFAFGAFSQRPDVVIKPASVLSGDNAIPKVVNFANRYKIPIVVKGGIGWVGATTCREGGILIDISDMNSIFRINPELQYVVVEAGTSIYKIHRELRNYDMILPNFGTYESGTLISSIFNLGSGLGYGQTRYGLLSDLVIGVEVVFPDGEVVKFGALSNEDTPFGPFQKNIRVPDFVGSFCLSYGSFGIVTRLVLKTIEGKRDWLHHYCYSFKRDEIDKTQEAMLKLSKEEIYDIHANDRWCYHWPMAEGFIDESKVPKDAWFFIFNTLFAKTENELKVKEERMRAIYEEYGGVENKEICDKYVGTEDRWQAYHITGPKGWLTFLCRHCGSFLLIGLGTVPLTSFKETYELYEQARKEFGLWTPERFPTVDMYVSKHSGIEIDALAAYNPYDKESSVDILKCLFSCLKRTTEQGIHYLPGGMKQVFEKSGNAYNFVKRFKKMVDPNNIMNPGSLT